MSDWDWDDPEHHGPMVGNKPWNLPERATKLVKRPLHRPSKDEWLPRPHHGQFMVPGRKQAKGTIHVQIVPGPGGRYQIVRVELATPVARGFKTKENARKWIERAIKEGILPPGIVEVEPGQ